MNDDAVKRATGANPATTSGSGPGGRGAMGNHDGHRKGIPELGTLQFKMKTKDQADMYLRTREALAEYVGVTLSYEMLLLVSQGHETTFTKPTPPIIPATRSATLDPAGDLSPVVNMRLEDFKAELANYHKDQRKYDKDKATVFVLIVGQCSDVVKRALESDPEFIKMKVNRDVVSLMNRLKILAFSKSTKDDPVMGVIESVKRVAILQQGTHQSVIN